MGSLASEGELGAREWPLLVLPARGLCPLTPAATVRSQDPGGGGEGAVQGLIENRDEFIKFSFVWVWGVGKCYIQRPLLRCHATLPPVGFGFLSCVNENFVLRVCFSS